MRHRKGVDPEEKGGGKEVGWVEEGEIAIKIYCVEKTLFSIKEKEYNIQV